MINENSKINYNIHWNKQTTYALNLYKIITKMLGLWPFDNDKISAKIQFFIVIMSQVTMAVNLLFEMILECGEVNDVIQMCSLVACNILVLSKLSFLYINEKKMFAIISSAIEDWQSITNPNIIKIFRKNAKLGRFVCIFQMTSAYITVSMILLGSLPFLVPTPNEIINSTVTVFKPLPLRTVCVFGQMSSFIYSIVFIFQAIQLFFTCTANIGCDCYFFGITLHVTSQFEHLAYEYENFCRDNNSNTSTSEDQEAADVLPLVLKHNKYLLFAHYLEATFNFNLLFQLSANMAQISLNGMQLILSLQTGDIAIAINFIIICYIFHLQIFLYTYAGERLSSGIENLRNAIYFSPWYDLSLKMNKNVCFIMMKANRTFYLTAGKMINMNIESFKNILKATFSYFSFLRAMIT